MHRVDATGATLDNRYTIGPPGTRIAPKHLNAIQEELCRLVELAGLTLDDENDEQVYAAVIGLITARSHRSAFVTLTAATALTAANHVVYLNATGGAFNVTLPAPASAAGCFLRFHRVDSSANVVGLTGTVNGFNDYVINGEHTALTIHSNGTAWSAFS